MFQCLSHRMMRSVCSIGRNARDKISSSSSSSSNVSGAKSVSFLSSVHIQCNNIPVTVNGLRLFSSSSTTTSSTNTTTKKETRPLSPLRHFRILRRENPNLRVHAVSLWDSDYSDSKTISITSNDVRKNRDMNDIYNEVRNNTEEEVDDDADIARRVKADEKKEQERLAKVRKSLVTEYPTIIDSLGRSFGRGGRKTSTAQVWIEPGDGCFTVNRQPFIHYFTRETHREDILRPLLATQTCGKFDIIASVRGGGHTGQAGAVRHGISRALHAWNPEEYRPILKTLGYLTRDSRVVERKKPGLKKARKASQWRKR